MSNDFQMIGVEFEVRGDNFIVGKSRRLFEGTAVAASAQTPTRAMPVDERNASPLMLATNWLSTVKELSVVSR